MASDQERESKRAFEKQCIEAVERQDIQELTMLANSGRDIANKAWITAGKLNHIHIIKWAHENGIFCNELHKSLALMGAAECGHLKLVKLLITNELGIEISKEEKDFALKCGIDMTGVSDAFFYALIHGHLRILEYLHEEGCELLEPAGGFSRRIASYASVGVCNLECLKYLIEEIKYPFDHEKMREASSNADIRDYLDSIRAKCEKDEDGLYHYTA